MIAGTLSANSIDRSFVVSPGGTLTLEAKLGSIEVSTSATNSVDVHSDFDVTDGHQTKRSISGKIDGGGPELYVHTSGGSVHIERRKP